MKEMNETINELLLGCQVGMTIYKNYCAQVEDEALRNVLKQAIEMLREHEETLMEQTQITQTNQIESLNFKSTLSVTWENLKAMTFTSDQQFLDAAVSAIATALNTLDSMKENEDCDEALLQTIHELEKDYRKIYDDLTLLK